MSIDKWKKRSWGRRWMKKRKRKDWQISSKMRALMCRARNQRSLMSHANQRDREDEIIQKNQNENLEEANGRRGREIVMKMTIQNLRGVERRRDTKSMKRSTKTWSQRNQRRESEIVKNEREKRKRRSLQSRPRAMSNGFQISWAPSVVRQPRLGETRRSSLAISSSKRW